MNVESTVRLANRSARAIALVGFAGLVVIALATLASVLSRWLLNTELEGVRDLITLAIPVVVASSFPSGLTLRQNIAIRFLGKKLGPKAYGWLEVFADGVLLFFFAAMAWQFAEYAVYLFETGELSYTLERPLAPWWAVTAVLMALCVPLQMLVLAGALHAAISGRTVIPQGEAVPFEFS
jgi:TRAP-type transport system small permease protein